MDPARTNNGRVSSGAGAVTHGYTYSGHPVACAVALANIRLSQGLERKVGERTAELSEAVALKVIRREFADNEEADARFKRELSVARQVTHTNVVRIHDLGTIDGVRYISMPFIEGIDLAAHRSRALEHTNFAAVYAPLPGNLTVEQNLRIFALLYRVKAPAMRIETVIDQFDAMTIGMSYNSAVTGGTSRPNVLRNPSLSSSERTLARWYDVSAFALPALYTAGNAGRGLIYGPPRNSLNLSVGKRFYGFGNETRNLELRGEFFNITNTPSFNSPNVTVDAGNAGKITSSGNERQVQLGLKFYF